MLYTVPIRNWIVSETLVLSEAPPEPAMSPGVAWCRRLEDTSQRLARVLCHKTEFRVSIPKNLLNFLPKIYELVLTSNLIKN